MRSVFSYNKRDELYMHILEHKYDIVGLSETWANDNISDSELNIPGYSLYRKDRNNKFKSKGGGVALYINENLVSRHNDILPDTECEAIWAKISLSKNSHLHVGVCYRSPSSTTEESMQLTKVIETAANNYALIFGDFHYPSIDWEKLDADKSTRYFLNLVTDSFLTQHVSSPARGSNILDLVFTTEPGMVEEVQVRENLANCDHNILT